jgi:hypothetical protein
MVRQSCQLLQDIPSKFTIVQPRFLAAVNDDFRWLAFMDGQAPLFARRPPYGTPLPPLPSQRETVAFLPQASNETEYSRKVETALFTPMSFPTDTTSQESDPGTSKSAFDGLLVCHILGGIGG